MDEHQNNTALAAIDATAFPGTPGANGEGAFWSSTPMTKFAQRDESLTVNFLDGFGDFAPTSSTQFVRCVR